MAIIRKTLKSTDTVSLQLFVLRELSFPTCVQCLHCVRHKSSQFSAQKAKNILSSVRVTLNFASVASVFFLDS